MEKKIALLVLPALLCCTVLQAQLRKIPSEVTDAFKEKFPGATNVEWKDNLTNFEADFTLNEESWSALFNSKGEWKESDKHMDFDELPSEIKDGFEKSKYADWQPGNSKLIQQKDKAVVYKVYAEKNNIFQKVYLYFNEKGQLIKDAPGI
jgi:hypothetical protein